MAAVDEYHGKSSGAEINRLFEDSKNNVIHTDKEPLKSTIWEQTRTGCT